MTARDLLRLVLRRWYVMMAGAVLTVATMGMVLHQPGVYWTDVTVVLLSPTEKYYPNKIQDPRYSMAPMAGLLVADWNGSHRPLLTASGDTTLYGEGLRRGVEVRLPNQGSQWLPLYTTPNISIQVVGADPNEVAEQAMQVASELDSLLREKQDAAGIDKSVRMSTITSPTTPTVAYVSGSRPRTMLSIALIGSISTTAILYWLERLIERRRRTSPGSIDSTELRSGTPLEMAQQ